MSTAAPSPPTLGLADLSPSNFGMVMATGIVSIAMHQLGHPRLALALLAVNAVLYGALWLLSALRLLRHPARVRADLLDHARAPGFFTWVAATGVLGSQCVLLAGAWRAGWWLWGLTVALWLLLVYGILTLLTVRATKPALERGINGVWLLTVVATQSIAVLGVLLAPQLAGGAQHALYFMALALWLSGGMLYIWIMGLIFYRTTFLALAPEALTPPYWINMGAMAISTLAGAQLVLAAPQLPWLRSLQPFIEGFTLFYWASGSWWIPMLLLLGVWRYVIRRVPLRYDPMYWGAVFPLGMYAVCTLALARALELDFLAWLPPLFGAAALLAWMLAFGGLLHRIGRQLRQAGRRLHSL